MKTTGWHWAICLLAIMLWAACNKEKPLTHSSCKSFDLKTTGSYVIHGSDTSCLCYTYNAKDRKLTLKHINAAFNCCPGNLYCDTDIEKDTLVLTESEEKAACDCNCLYDLEITVSNVGKQKYTLRVEEPYCGDEAKMQFEMDLNQHESGEFCVLRTHYPWGI